MKKKLLMAMAAEVFTVVLIYGYTTIPEAYAEAVKPKIAVVKIEDAKVPLAEGIKTPQAAGTKVYENNKVTLDVSNAAQGYCMIRYGGRVPKIKVQITKETAVYTYDLNARASYETFPFSMGSGNYSVKVFENITGNQYSQAFSENINVNLADEFLPFLYPNQYVDFSPGSAVVQLGTQLAAGTADQVGVVAAVYDYVVNNITYDMAKANSVQSGYLPDVDLVLAAKTGICFDYAAVMTAMLRSQGIPTKLVIGYTGNVYHAWINVFIENQGWVDNLIYFDGHNWQLMDPTFASTGGQSEKVKKYISNSENYQEKYIY